MIAHGLHDIPIKDIDATVRLRPIDDAWAAALAENILETGSLNQPIQVRALKTGGYRLIAGGHRLAAFVRLDRATIPAFVLEGNDDEARLAEIDENLVRHELNPLDRATFLAERKAIYERLHPATKKGGDRRRQNEAISFCAFTQDTADRIGLTRRTVELAVSIVTKLAPDVREAISGTPLARIQADLLALAKLGPADQRAVLGLLRGDKPKAASVREAIGQLKGRTAKTPDPYTKLMTTWRHASPAERRAFIAFLRREGFLAADPPGAHKAGNAA